MVAPSTQALLTQWHWEPSVLLGIAVLAGAYFYVVGPLREKHDWGPPATRRQISYFIISLVLLVLSLLSPLDAISDRYLFSVHMVQHLLLATLWPPLFIMAIPAWMARLAFRLPGAFLLEFFTYPAVALILFNLDVYVWHFPAFYDATLNNEAVHIAEHVSFMLFGVFNWWPVLSPISSQRLPSPLQVLYLFADGMFMMVLGIVFTFAPSAFYSAYVSAPRLWGLSPQTDQEIGGLIMWYPGNLPYGVLLVVAFYRWFDAGGPSESDSQRIVTQSPTIGPPAQ